MRKMAPYNVVMTGLIVWVSNMQCSRMLLLDGKMRHVMRSQELYSSRPRSSHRTSHSIMNFNNP